MAVLEKIRVKFGLAISIIIALALLSFIIDPSTLESALHSMSSKYDVGLINGKAISYTDYMADVDRYTVINEIISGSSVHNEQAQQQIRDAAWQELIDKNLFVKKAKEAGLTVGQDELVELTTGANASPIISQMPFFADENGNFSVDQLVNFVQSVDSDQTGRVKTFWNYLQNSVYTQQFYGKYGALFTASAFQNPLEKEAVIAQNNTTANVDYVLVNYPVTEDSTIVVSDSEIKKYYNDRKKYFKQNASRDIEYVVFEVVPSAKDIEDASAAFNKAYDEFCTTDNMKSFLAKNSERQLSQYWYKAGELNTINKEINDFIFSDAKGASPIVNDKNTFLAAKEIASAQISDSVYVKHILLQGADAKQKADSILNVVSAKGASFSAVAMECSADKNSADGGEMGNIGWMTQTYMIPGFESVITAEIGKPYIVNTQYGTHVILVSEKTKPVLKKQVAIMEKTTLASKETFNSFYSQANRFATIASHSLEGYKRAVDSLGVYSHQLKIQEGTASYGSVDNAKEITRWAFDNKVGKASDIITINNNFFFIATVKGIHKEGYTPVSEVASMIKQNLYSEKLAEKQKAEVASKIAGLNTLEEIATALGSTVTPDNNLSFSSMSGYGQDPVLAGAALNAPLSKISGPVAGMTGVYVFKVNTRETGTFYTAEDAEALQAQKSQYSAQMIVPEMMQAADVKDNRARFF